MSRHGYSLMAEGCWGGNWCCNVVIQQHSVAEEEKASGDGREGTEYGGNEMVVRGGKARELVGKVRTSI